MKRLYVFILLLVSCVVCFAQNQQQDKCYYMMNAGDTRELPAGNYVSSDEKIAIIKNNRIAAVSNGDCLIYVNNDGKRTELARVTVGWQVQNPILPYSWKLYLTDGEVHNFNGKIYTYQCWDISDKMYASPYYMQMKTADMRRWDVQKIFSSHDASLPNAIKGKILWDCEGSFYNGKYLLYGFCIPRFYPNKPGGNYMFVLESDAPAGTYKNFRWIVGNKTGEKIDGMSAQVLVDDDGSRYITYATYPQSNYNTPVVARLIDDHVIDEASRKSLAPYVKDFFENASLRKRRDTYYLIYAENIGAVRSGNFTPKRLSYCTSKNIFGPYLYRGNIITVEHLQGNTNIQGTIEQFNGQWYVFYHRVLNGLPYNRSECVEKIEFDKDGLIIPVVPTSSGASEGLDTSLPVWFNTAVYGSNYHFTTEGKHGSVSVNGIAEIGFRYIAFSGSEKQITLQGSGLENVVYVKVIANGRTIGSAAGSNPIELKEVLKGKTEMSFLITTTGNVRLETFHFSF
jgi:hypothetical protein